MYKTTINEYYVKFVKYGGKLGMLIKNSKKIVKYLLIIFFLFELSACKTSIIVEQSNQNNNAIQDKSNFTLSIESNDLLFPLSNYYLRHNDRTYFFYLGNTKKIYVKHVASLDGIKEIISMDDVFNVGLFKDGSVKYWTTEELEKKQDPYQIKNFTCTKIVGGYKQVFYLKSDGTVWYSSTGLTSSMLFNRSNIMGYPKQIASLKAIRIIDIASPQNDINNNLLAVTSDGKVISWNNTESKIETLYENKDIKKIVTGENEDVTFVLTKQGELFRWGDSTSGLFGVTKSDNDLTTKIPKKLNLPSKVKQVSICENYVLALLEDGTLWGWGYPDDGESLYPAVVKDEKVRKLSITGVKEIFSGDYASVAYMADGSIKQWGSDWIARRISGKSDYKDIKTLSMIVVKNNELVINAK